MTEHKGPDDWVRAGLQCLKERGIDAVRVEPLAKALGVTKGSFYWHFADRPALLAALLAAWQAIGTDAIAQQVNAKGGGPDIRLRNLMLITAESDGRLDMAIRAWAATDLAAADALTRVDRRRMDFVRDLLCELGVPVQVATSRARLLYCALIGEFTLRGEMSADDRRAAVAANHAMLTRLG
jgi:AcrR family transcriptional regulator